MKSILKQIAEKQDHTGTVSEADAASSEKLQWEVLP